MNKSPAPLPPEDDAKEPEFKKWTADEARLLREQSPSVSPWRVIGWQIMAGVAIALGAWLLSGEVVVAVSAGYGALTVILPAAVMARGIMSPTSSLNAVSAAMGFMVWEMVKIGLSVAMFFAAPQLIPGLSWLALLVGLILTMKVYWVAAFYKPKPRVVIK
ncbi:MAG: ATP synthase subunit I [Burkholderiaceae bacterium]